MLIWNITSQENYTLHSTLIDLTTDQDVRYALEACADKAISLLEDNIQDDSLYLLFEWDIKNTTLTITPTDATKTHDAPQIVKGIFTELANSLANATEENIEACTDSIKFWLHDYLTTCTAFFSYSLVAIFHSSTRNNTELL